MIGERFEIGFDAVGRLARGGVLRELLKGR